MARHREAVIGDLHLAKLKRWMPNHLALQISCLHFIMRRVVDEGIKRVIFLGDTFDSPIVSLETVKALMEFINTYPDIEFVWKMVKGPRSLKRDQEIDHIDGNGQNNIIKNLRRVSHLGNHKNLKLAKNNKSGVTGVHRHGDKWKATGYKTVDGKNIQKHLGTFDTKKQAQNARLRWQKDLDYHELHGAKKYA